MKCEFSAAKGTRAAPLPVIGLAPFPKNPLSPAFHLLLLCSVLLLFASSHHLPALLIDRAPVYAAVSWALLERSKAGKIVLVDAGRRLCLPFGGID